MGSSPWGDLAKCSISSINIGHLSVKIRADSEYRKHRKKLAAGLKPVTINMVAKILKEVDIKKQQLLTSILSSLQMVGQAQGPYSWTNALLPG